MLDVGVLSGVRQSDSLEKEAVPNSGGVGLYAVVCNTWRLLLTISIGRCTAWRGKIPCRSSQLSSVFS